MGPIGRGICGGLESVCVWLPARIATVSLLRDRLRSAATIVSMDPPYDCEREAVAAMKLAAEADGPERQRWITAALAWSELTRLRGAAEDNLPEGRSPRQLIIGARRSASHLSPSR
jgi:hypothetical protein